jgi:hypothetical protein
MGLPSAVQWYAEQFAKRTGIQVSLEIPNDFGRLSPSEGNCSLQSRSGVTVKCATTFGEHDGNRSYQQGLSSRLPSGERSGKRNVVEILGRSGYQRDA